VLVFMITRIVITRIVLHIMCSVGSITYDFEGYFTYLKLFEISWDSKLRLLHILFPLQCIIFCSSLAKPHHVQEMLSYLLRRLSLWLNVLDHKSLIVFFSGRELTFAFAICYRPSVCLSSVCL